MIPIVVTMGEDPYRLGRRAVAIALRNDAHRIVGMACRYRSFIDKKCQRLERVGLSFLIPSGALWFLAMPGSMTITFVVGVLVPIGILSSARGALLRQRQRDNEAVLDLALHIREMLDEQNNDSSDSP